MVLLFKDPPNQLSAIRHLTHKPSPTTTTPSLTHLTPFLTFFSELPLQRQTNIFLSFSSLQQHYHYVYYPAQQTFCSSDQWFWATDSFWKVGKETQDHDQLLRNPQCPGYLYLPVRCPTLLISSLSENFTHLLRRFDVNITPDVPPILNRYDFPHPSTPAIHSFALRQCHHWCCLRCYEMVSFHVFDTSSHAHFSFPESIWQTIGASGLNWKKHTSKLSASSLTAAAWLSLCQMSALTVSPPMYFSDGRNVYHPTSWRRWQRCCLQTSSSWIQGPHS